MDSRREESYDKDISLSPRDDVQERERKKSLSGQIFLRENYNKKCNKQTSERENAR